MSIHTSSTEVSLESPPSSGGEYDHLFGRALGDYLLDRLGTLDPLQTELHWDLDVTMFAGRVVDDPATGKRLIGRWSDDMLVTIETLAERGFTSHYILSSARLDYIESALAIFRQQFGQEPPFGQLVSSLNPRKLEARLDILERLVESGTGRQAVFIEDVPPDPEEEPDSNGDCGGYHYIELPADLHYTKEDVEADIRQRSRLYDAPL